MYDDGDVDTSTISRGDVVTRPSATSTASSRSYSSFLYIDGLKGRQYPQLRVSRVQRTPIL